MKPKIIINDSKHLEKVIEKEISRHGNNCDLNHLDVSKVTDMKYIFYMSKFNGDISSWNVSNVTDMSGIFFESKFNGDISSWDVSNVTDMKYMFYNSKFNNNLDDWRPCKLQDKKGMFDDYIAPIPYWYTAENTQKAINSYELKEKLENNLDNKNIIKIKMKMKI